LQVGTGLLSSRPGTNCRTSRYNSCEYANIISHELLLYYEVPLGEFRAGFENHGRPVGTRQIGALRRAGDSQRIARSTDRYGKSRIRI